MNSFVSDKKLLWLTKVFIYDDEIDKGIPIGNYTSQYFANIYLSILDRYVKEVLKVRYYVRYMDDMVILLSTKEKCRIVMGKIKKFLINELKLELNSKSRYYPSEMGVNFCGYRIYDGYRLIRNSSKRKIKKRIKKWKKDKNMGCLDRKKMMLSFNSWSSHIRHANSYHIYQKIYRETEGMVCSEFVMCYPPGIPILAPGERITAEILDYIEYAKAKGCNMTGPEDPDILKLNVLTGR